MTESSKYIDCPSCHAQIRVTLEAPGPRTDPVGNGILADLKHWTDKGTITIDQSRNPLVIRMPYDPTDEGKRNWRTINALVVKHGGAWIKAGAQSRWEVPA